jgi:hypothetical protein
MTEIARRILDRARPGRDARAESEPTSAARPSEPVTLTLALPEGLDSAVAHRLSAGVQRLLAGISGELKLSSRLKSVLQRSSTGDIGTLSINGRPAAVFQRPSGTDREDIARIAGAAATRATRRLSLLLGSEVGQLPSLTSYVVDLGLPRPELVADGRFDVERAELLINQSPTYDLHLAVSEATLRRVPEGGAAAMRTLRERELLTYGVRFPHVHLTPTEEPPGTVSLRINAITLPPRALGADAGWPDVVDYLGAQLTHCRHWFLKVSDLDERIDRDHGYLFPDLVAVAKDNYSSPALTACLRELTRANGSVRNLPRILWLLLEQGAPQAGPDAVRLAESPLLPKARSRPEADRDPVLLAARVRKIAFEEAWRLRSYTERAPAVRLSAEIERRLLRAESGADLGAAEWDVVRAVMSAPEAALVVTRYIESIAPVRAALQALKNPPNVRASHELPPDADLAAMQVMRTPTPVEQDT